MHERPAVSAHKDNYELQRVAGIRWPAGTGPHIPTSLARREQAVKRAHAAYNKTETQAREQQDAPPQPVAPTADEAIDGEPDDDVDESA